MVKIIFTKRVRDGTIESRTNPYHLLRSVCPLCLQWRSVHGGHNRVIYGTHGACHGLTDPSFSMSDDPGQLVSYDGLSSREEVLRLASESTEQDFINRKVVWIQLYDDVRYFSDEHDKMAFVVHAGCFSLFARLLRHDFPGVDSISLAWTIAQSMSPLWDATRLRPYEERTRRRAILHDAAANDHFSKLGEFFAACDPASVKTFFQIQQLPLELREHITGYVDGEDIHRSLIVMQMISDFKPVADLATLPKITFIDLKRSIYVCRRKVAGRHYILRAANNPFPGSELSLTPCKARSLNVEFDDFGIISLADMISSQASEISTMRRVPWESWYDTWAPGSNSESQAVTFARKGVGLAHYCPVWSDDAVLVFTNSEPRINHITIRLLIHPGLHDRIPKELIWQRTTTISKKTRCIGMISPINRFRHLRFQLYTCEESSKPMSSLAFEGELDSNIGTPDVVYQHFPLSPKETITGIWVREEPETRDLDGLFMLSTSHGRTMIFGPHKDSIAAQWYRPRRIFDSTQGTPRTLNWSMSRLPDESAYTIGCTYIAEQAAHAAHPSSDVPPEFYPMALAPTATGDQEEFFGFANEDWYYSIADAEGLRAIQLCVDTSREDTPTSGMMLHYDNDRRECLGQWRSDYKIGTVYKYPCFPMVRKYRYSNHRTPSIQVIIRRADEPGEDLQDDGYEELRTHGKLVWWYGPYGNVLDYLP